MSTERDLIRALHEFTVRSCCPIYWHDGQAPPPKPINGACSFVLRLPERLVGVTADHVVRTFETNKSANPTTVFQFWNFGFDFLRAIIDRDERLDIATFSISEQQLAASGRSAFDCRTTWPPPPPNRGQLLTIAGYPGFGRVAKADMSADFETYVGFAAVEDFSDRDIVTTYDPRRDIGLGGKGAPPLGLNLSGCSGGPAVMHGTVGGLHRWFPMGLIIGGPRKAEGEAASVETITVRRIHFIRQDGTIDKQDTGWLPS